MNASVLDPMDSVDANEPPIAEPRGKLTPEKLAAIEVAAKRCVRTRSSRST